MEGVFDLSPKKLSTLADALVERIEANLARLKKEARSKPASDAILARARAIYDKDNAAHSIETCALYTLQCAVYFNKTEAAAYFVKYPTPKFMKRCCRNNCENKTYETTHWNAVDPDEFYCNECIGWVLDRRLGSELNVEEAKMLAPELIKAVKKRKR